MWAAGLALRGAPEAAAGERDDNRHQLRRVEWLGDVHVEAGLKGPDPDLELAAYTTWGAHARG